MEEDERPSKMRKLDNDEASASTGLQVLENPERGEPTAGSLQSAELSVEEQSASVDSTNGGYEPALPRADETAPLLSGPQTSTADPPLSKSKMKKLRKEAEWEAKKPERKAIKKTKLKAKRERKREEKRLAAEADPEAALQAKLTQNPRRTNQLPITILIDCDFDNLMLDGERVSLATQITRSYSDNKKSPYRAHLTICSFGGELRNRFDNILAHYKNWTGLRTYDCDFVETAELAKAWMTGSEGGQMAGVFSRYAKLDEAAKNELKEQGEVVYLTSEGDEDLTELKPYSTYIIGGLVDRNREKGICYKRAKARNVRTAKLPIGEFLEMSSRKVLATNHVNEIMLRWLECGDWGEAFVKVIPKRKGGKLKSAKGAVADEEEDDDGEEKGNSPRGGQDEVQDNGDSHDPGKKDGTTSVVD